MKYFKNYDIIYVKQKSKGIFIVIGLYPIEIGKKKSGTFVSLLSDEIILNVVISESCTDRSFHQW